MGQVKARWEMAQKIETPRYGHDPIEMRMIFEGEPASWAGVFFWHLWGAHRCLYVTIPSNKAPDGFVWIGVPVGSVGEGEEEGVWRWDDNEEKPTLEPSVHTHGHWHGFVRGGMLVEA